jgi:hypothetical protein
MPLSGSEAERFRRATVLTTLSGGCHLNRPIQKLIEDGGFQIDRLETGYMRGPKPLTFNV